MYILHLALKMNAATSINHTSSFYIQYHFWFLAVSCVMESGEVGGTTFYSIILVVVVVVEITVLLRAAACDAAFTCIGVSCLPA